MWIADFSIRRPVFAVMVISALASLGWISLGRVGVDLFPDVEFPYVFVSTVLKGASPETMEIEVTDIIEENVNTISGVKSLRSESSEDISQVFIEFELEEDIDIKAQDVRDKVSIALRDLPPDIDPPVVEKVDPDAAPILSIMISGDMPIGELTDFADDTIKENIQRIAGVGSVTLIGGREREIKIWLDANNLRAFGLTAQDIVQALRAEHAEVPSGRLETAGRLQEFTFKTIGEVTSVSEFGDIVVAFHEDAPTYLRDVAVIEDGLEDERTYAEFNGRTGISLEVRRQSGRNIVEVARAVKEAVEALKAEAPPGIDIVVARDVARFIESSARDVMYDIVIGIVLVVLVTLAFLLSVRATVIVAIAIPTALISTFFAFYLFDFTINMLTLMALSVAVGLLVDDAIVVLESIQRAVDEGHPPMKAASIGVKRVGHAVLAGTFSVMAVFLPIAFMEGVVGRFFFQYGLTIVFSVSVSLLVSLTLTPMLCARTLSRTVLDGGVLSRFEAAYSRLEGFYERSLRKAFDHRWLVFALAAASIIVAGFFARTIPFAFTSRADRSELLAFYELPLGTGIEATKESARRVARRLRDHEEINDVFFTIGGGARSKVNVVDYYLALTPKQRRDVGHLNIMADARRLLNEAVPEARKLGVTEVPWISGGGLTAFEIELALKGSSLAILEEKTEAIMARMRETGLYADVQSGYEPGKPELQVIVDRPKAADLGVSVETLATTSRILVGGLDAVTYEEEGDRYDVNVRLREDQRIDPRQLELLQVRARDGRLIDLANIADIRFASGPAQIDRQDRTRRISIFANTAQGISLGPATDKLNEIVEKIGLDPGYAASFRGSAERMTDSIAAIRFAFIMALIALYMILASQFNSFVQPAVIMLTAPLAFSGSFVILSLAGAEMSLFTQIGFIALMGLVMKNGILLVDYANQLREDGRSPMEAMLGAGPLRLRPILMTALSTIFGMIPVALSTSDGAEWRNPMGILVIGGLVSSTLLTLYVVPVAYGLIVKPKANQP